MPLQGLWQTTTLTDLTNSSFYSTNTYLQNNTLLTSNNKLPAHCDAYNPQLKNMPANPEYATSQSATQFLEAP